VCCPFFSWLHFLNPTSQRNQGISQKDKSIYGSGAHDKVAPEELNPWQQGVDDSLSEAAAAEA